MTRPRAPRPPPGSLAHTPHTRGRAVRVAAPDGPARDAAQPPAAGPAQRDLDEAYRVSLTALGALALAADRLEACHREAHPEGCPGCDTCLRLLPQLHQLLAAGRPGDGAPVYAREGGAGGAGCPRAIPATPRPRASRKSHRAP
jgi:hypothetical protein